MEAKDRLIRARIQIQRNNPFFAYLSLYLKFHEVDKEQVPTMGVDASGNLYYNPEFVDGLSDEKLQGVVIHEILHLTFLHLTRRGVRDREIWNIAVDIAANNILTNNGQALPDGGLIPHDNSIDLFGIKVDDIQKKNAEQIYDEIYKKASKMAQKCKTCGFDIHMEGKGDPGNGNGKDQKGKGKHKHMPLTDKERNEIEKDWQQKAIDAATTARMKGDLPAGMELLLGKLHENKIPWKTILKQQIQSQIPYDFSYARPNKKSISCGVYMPDYVKERIKVLIAVDTSGSIGTKERVDFLSEIIGMARGFKDKIEMVLLTHDTEVQNDYVIENGNVAKIQKLKFNGGGGTSHEPVMEHIKSKHRDCKLAIFFTDGYSDLDDFDMNKYRFTKMFLISEGGSAEQLKGKPAKVIKLDEYK